ncbi:MAG: hypothetical protein ABIB97_04785 [Patescibacteria group bacterium]
MDSAQFQTCAIVLVPVQGNFNACAIGQLVNVPSEGLENWYYYAGPAWMSDGGALLVMPLVGQITNRGLEGQDATIASLWSIWQPTEKFKLFVQGDMYTYGDETEYLGWLTTDYFLTPDVTCGFHVERNVGDLYTDTTIGPHVGITKGPCRLELQWHGSIEGKTHALRLYTEFLFF